MIYLLHIALRDTISIDVYFLALWRVRNSNPNETINPLEAYFKRLYRLDNILLFYIYKLRFKWHFVSYNWNRILH